MKRQCKVNQVGISNGFRQWRLQRHRTGWTRSIKVVSTRLWNTQTGKTRVICGPCSMPLWLLRNRQPLRGVLLAVLNILPRLTRCSITGLALSFDEC